MYAVGITGNIASGKSTAINCFKALGASVINADQIAKELTERDQPAFYLIKNHFGEQVLMPNGDLNRAFLRHLIFSDKNQRLWLENLLHPMIRQTIKTRIAMTNKPYSIIEIPLLTHREDYPYLDRILVIQSQDEKQIARVIARDHCTREAALAILAVQPTENSRKEIADDLVKNNGTEEEFIQIIKNLHQTYLQLAIEKSL